MTGLRVIRMNVDGTTHTPIVAKDGRVVGRTGVERLSKVIDLTAERRIRRCTAILLDESPLPTYREEDLARFRHHGLEIPETVQFKFSTWQTSVPANIPLVFADFRVGTVEMVSPAPAGVIPEVVGSCLVGMIRFSRTALASIIWNAVGANVLRGICLELSRIHGSISINEFKKVHIGNREDSCCPGARIIEWEEASPISGGTSGKGRLDCVRLRAN